MYILCIYYFAQVDSFRRRATTCGNLMVMGKSEFPLTQCLKCLTQESIRIITTLKGWSRFTTDLNKVLKKK